MMSLGNSRFQGESILIIVLLSKNFFIRVKENIHSTNTVQAAFQIDFITRMSANLASAFFPYQLSL